MNYKRRVRMLEQTKQVIPVNIEDELKQSYLGYAMSVIVGRALPDVRDGLKPVHRRVLFAMHELNNDWNKPYKKSARVVGDVIGKYHPHGDSAVYDAIVRMAQPFSLRYVLVDGQGNFGSVDGDSPAAMRYTEIRMDKISHSLLADLEKETVDFVPNYDGTEYMPEVLPTRVPNLLINGSSGIAVGMATNIPPHNLSEVVSGCLALIDNPNMTIDELMEYIPGPDFPTAGIINGRAGIVEAYRTGRGKIYVRARYDVETNPQTNKSSIIINEIPYQLNKARLIERIAELVKEKKIEGITELRDESDKDGLRIVIELRRGESPDVVVNNLLTQTQLETVFGINIVALVGGQPKTLNLKNLLNAFVRHRREVVTRRTLFDLRKAKERGHVLEGLTVALASIDPIIAVIKASKNAQEAKQKLLESSWQPGQVLTMLERAGKDACRPNDLDVQYGLHDAVYFLSPVQAQAILDLRLHRLTGLETEKLIAEYQDIITQIEELNKILANPERLLEVIREELVAIKDEFGDERRTEIIESRRGLSLADLIPEETVVVTLSHLGYAKNQQLETYQSQHRGGKGKSAASIKEEDFVEKLLVVNSHETILCFTNFGRVYWLKAYEIPQATRISKGRPMVNILNLQEKERVTTMLSVPEFNSDHFVVMATSAGTIKKTSLEHFSRPRSVGLIAIDLDEGDTLIGAAITDGSQEIMLINSDGRAVCFPEEQARAMGRTARGVRGIRNKEGSSVVALMIPKAGDQILTVSELGYGKRTHDQEFPRHRRGGSGVIAMQTSDRNGKLVGAIQVSDDDQAMLISDQGTLVRIPTHEISLVSRNTQGVRLIKLKTNEKLMGIERVFEEIEPDGEGEE